MLIHFPSLETMSHKTISVLGNNCYNFYNDTRNVRIKWPKDDNSTYVTLYQGSYCQPTPHAPHNVTFSKDIQAAKDGTPQCLPVPNKDGVVWTPGGGGSVLLGSGKQPWNFEEGW